MTSCTATYAPAPACTPCTCQKNTAYMHSVHELCMRWRGAKTSFACERHMHTSFARTALSKSGPHPLLQAEGRRTARVACTARRASTARVRELDWVWMAKMHSCGLCCADPRPHLSPHQVHAHGTISALCAQCRCATCSLQHHTAASCLHSARQGAAQSCHVVPSPAPFSSNTHTHTHTHSHHSHRPHHHTTTTHKGVVEAQPVADLQGAKHESRQPWDD
jgi:hypothetical protein